VERPPHLQEAGASPAVRKLARELGVDLSEVAATGPAARITDEDVKSHVRDRLAKAERGPRREPTERHPELPDLSRWGEIEREPLGGIRKATAAHVARSWSEIPHGTQGDRADITELEGFRRRGSKERDLPLTPTAILATVCARALRRFPRFNSAIDPVEEVRIQRRYVHVGVAVDTEHGLLVPVIRDVDDKGLSAVAEELAELSDKARERELRPEQMEGATFTITNLGGLGTTAFTPIIGWPQTAILGVGRARLEPVHVDELPPGVESAGEDPFVARRILPLSVTYDHRSVDGADAARFLRFICRALEQPWTLLE